MTSTSGATIPAEQARDMALRAMTERAFQARVIGLARLHGWRHHHQYDSRRSVSGWPDLVLLKGERMVALELKTERGRVSVAQTCWLVALERIPGVTARLVRPHDLDWIEGELAR